MSLLEQRYRTVLRLLPAFYRGQHEEALVRAYLDSAGEVTDDEDPKPTLSEIASVAALSLRVRLGDIDGRPERVRWGEVVRLVALLGLLYQAFIACLSIISSLYLLVDLYWSHHHRLPIGVSWGYQTMSQFSWGGLFLGDAVVIAGFLLVLGTRGRAAKVAALCVLAQVIYRTADRMVHIGPDGDLLSVLLGVVTATALALGFHRDAPPVTHRRRWFAAWIAGGGVVVGAQSLAYFWVSLDTITWLALPNVEACLLVAAGTIGYAVVHLRTQGRHSPAWPLALAVLTLTVLVMVFGYLGRVEPAPIITMAVIGAVATVVDILLARHAATMRPSRPVEPQD